MEAMWVAARVIAFTFIGLLLLSNMSNGYKILFMPGIMGGSHYIVEAYMGAQLVRQGHSVHFLVNDISDFRTNIDSHCQEFKFILYNSSYTAEEFRGIVNNYALHSMAGGLKSLLAMINNGMQELEAGANDCEAVIRDQHLVRSLKDKNFDLLVGDSLFHCPYVISELLQVPFLSVLASGIFPIQARQFSDLPSHPAYIPEFTTAMNDNMWLASRAYNSLAFLFLALGVDSPVNRVLQQYNGIKQSYGILPATHITDTIRKAELTIYQAGFTLEFSRPLMPNSALIGGFTAHPASPLDKDLEDFINSSGEDGVVVLSFGTYVNVMSRWLTELIARALGRLPQKVIWQFKSDDTPSVIGNNTLLVKWIPQNDLLAHPKIKAFVFHGGTNGIWEALYHGVPMVGIPLFGDQFDNVARMTSAGLGISLSMGSITEEALYQGIRQVITNQRYKETAVRLSQIHRAQPMNATDTAAFWIEHILMFGGGDLQPASLKLNPFQYYCLDIIFLWLSMVAFILYVLVKLARVIFATPPSLGNQNTSRKAATVKTRKSNRLKK